MRSRGRGGDTRIDPQKLKVVVRRLDEQLEKARDNARQLKDRDCQYDELRGVLEDLPEKLTHPVMVPFGPLAFFEGHLQHTNEVMIQLSSEWFAMKTAKHALGTVDRRKQRLRGDMNDVDHEVKELEAKKRLVVAEGAACGIQLGGRTDDSEGILDIREPCVDEPQRARKPSVAGATVTRDADGYLDIREPCTEDAGTALDCGVPGSTVTRDADGYLDIREPIDLEDTVIAEASEQPVAFVSASSSGRPKPDLERLHELQRLEELEGQDELDECTSEQPVASDSASSSGRCRPDLERLRELQRLEDLEQLEGQNELDELDALVESYERTGMPPGGARSSETTESASGSRASAGAEVRSPADLYRLMANADESATRPRPEEDSFAPPPRQLAEQEFAGGSEKAFSGQIQENLVKSLAVGAPAAGGTAAAPRVSKFKADRLKAGR